MTDDELKAAAAKFVKRLGLDQMLPNCIEPQDRPEIQRCHNGGAYVSAWVYVAYEDVRAAK